MNQTSTDLVPNPESIESSEELRSSSQTSFDRTTLDIAGAAIFGGLSIIASTFIIPNLPQVPGWGITYFDPISIIWICAFLIFGFKCGLYTFFIGMIGIAFFDDYVILGASMKFLATIWCLLVPYYILKFQKKTEFTGQNLKQYYFLSMFFAWLVRLPIMVLANIIMLKIMGWYGFISLSWLGMESISGFSALVVTVVFLNTIQALGDTILPYLLVYLTTIYDQFKIW